MKRRGGDNLVRIAGADAAMNHLNTSDRTVSVEQERRINRLPLYVAATAHCNMTCFYCTEHGESRDVEGGRLPTPELLRLLKIAHETGVRSFRFTGGEPTGRRDLDEVISATQAFGDDVQIALTTNGLRLAELIPTLSRLKAPKVFLSIDGIDARPAVGRHPIEKLLTPEIRGLIDRLPCNVQLRFNVVLTRANLPQLPAIVDFCEPRGINVKIFELLLRDFFYERQASSLDLWHEQFVSVREVMPQFRAEGETSEPFVGLGGRGIPMSVQRYGRIKLIYFDSRVGAHYHGECRKCPRYPCQEGMYAPILNAAGVLHPSACTNRDFHISIAFQPEEFVRSSFESLRQLIEDSPMSDAIPDYFNPRSSASAAERHVIPLPIL
jgi:MoaA/NifB/PqqE/SkfB family radical SAM enzyme